MKKILTTLLFLFSTNAYCDWFKIVESDSTITYIDDSKIKKKDKFIRVWTLTSQKIPVRLDNGKIYQSYVSLVEVDCREDRSRNLSTTLYDDSMGKGSPVVILNDVSKWSFSSPGSVGDSLIQFSCGFK